MIPFCLTGQDMTDFKPPDPRALSPGDMFVLANVPPLELPAQYQGSDAPLLPVSVDNSTLPYFRPITQQSGYECGQSAGIVFNFTYEIDRLRGLPANVGPNQYPSHFTWNFLNNANNYQGASFFDSWEIVRACGNMHVTDYGGGLNTGGYTRWITGYDKYYNGMGNRLTSVKSIRVDTPEGLQTLKYWLFDHLEGAATGGVANFYAQYFSIFTATFPVNTPEAGKYVQPNWGGSPSHAWTICGYNDSVRYDFNGDGQFTMNIDINGDGVVNMKDWEKGGLKFANGYAGTGWGNQGFCWTMYKNLADNIGFGGIWNHTVYVVDVQANCSPQLTMKVTLKHPSRNKLKVTAGVSNDLTATQPAYVLEFPIYNFQGGDRYMQGGTTEADKTIEFGLDLAPLLTWVNSTVPARFFLQVQENDPPGAYYGEVVNWSLVDYTGGTPVTTAYSGINIPMQNNATTRLALNYSLVFSKPVIANNSLPPAQIYQPYNVTLQAGGGTGPYLWDVKLDYPESSYPAPFPAVTAQQLTLTNNNTGYAIKTLDFQFPFYKKLVNKLYIYADGYIVFDDQPYTYPYLIDKNLLFRQTSILAPFMGDLAIYPSSGQGVWYEGNANYAIIRWKNSFYNMQGSTDLNFSVKIFPNGNIEYYYGTMTFPPGTAWTGGLSSGDNKNYQYSQLSGANSVAANIIDKFHTCGFPPEMTVTEDGHFTGTPSRSYQNLPIKFMVTDNNHITSYKTLMFNSVGLVVNQNVVSGGDSLIEFGETAMMSLTVNNIGSGPLNLLTFSISESDPYITLIDSVETISSIGAGQTLTLSNAFSFNISSQVPDNHGFGIVLHVQSQEQGFQRTLEMMAHAPVLKVTQVRLPDGDNGMLDPGENSDLLVTWQNQGGARVEDLHFSLTSLDPQVSLDINSGLIPLLKPDSSGTLTFHATAGANTSFEHVYPVKADVTGFHGFALTDTLYLFTGRIVEDFETNNFNRYPWFCTGQWPWFTDPAIKYEGSFSARSGVITENAESVFNLSARVLAPGEVSFYRYVSCEHDPSGSRNFDYLAFYIDGYEMGRWDGTDPWKKESFPVSAGLHHFSWVYHKDYTNTAGMDGVWLDNISLPLIGELVPALTVSPPYIEKTVATGGSATGQVQIMNNGGGILDYSVIVIDTTTGKKSHGTDNMTGSYVTCNVQEFVPGQAFNWIFAVHNQSSDQEYIRHVRFDFPPGSVVTGATNFSGGSLGELAFLGGGGNGASLGWHGESGGGRGVLKPGETAFATVTGTIADGFSGNFFVVYDLRGDSAGAAPHHWANQLSLDNLGRSNNWVTLSNQTGSVMHGNGETVGVALNSASLAPNHTYRCDVVVRDLFNNQKVVPVTFMVTWPVDIEDEKEIPANRLTGIHPNPFRDETRIGFTLSHGSDVTIEICSVQGVLVREWNFGNLSAGSHDIRWNGTDLVNRPLSPGVYVCRLRASGEQDVKRIIIIN